MGDEPLIAAHGLAPAKANDYISLRDTDPTHHAKPTKLVEESADDFGRFTRQFFSRRTIDGSSC
jgi:hypothetical protein